MKAILFDLDDTLYPERDFVRSGFMQVAAYLNSRYQFDKVKLTGLMIDIVKKDGRGKVFDTLLKDLGLYTPERLNLLVHLYRSHCPDIRLFADVIPVLKRLRENKIKLGLITDGMASVQKNKIASLRLMDFLDLCICCDELGKENWKPSEVPFRVALEFLQIPASQTAYVGDNARKDFVAPNALGMLSVQIKRPQDPADVAASNSREKDLGASQVAAKEIANLSEILSIIEQGEK